MLRQGIDDFLASGHSLDEAEALAQPLGDQNSEKGNRKSKAEGLVELLLGCGAEFFRDQRGDAFCSLPGNRTKIVSLKSREFRNWVCFLCFRSLGEVCNSETLHSVTNILSGIAICECPEHRLFTRVALGLDGIYYDLGDGRAARVTGEGWKIIDKPPILFRHWPHQRIQVEPIAGGNLKDILVFINIPGGEMQLIFLVYLVVVLIPDIPSLVLITHGDQGSGKTTAFRQIKALLDPSMMPTLAPPGNLRDFVITAQQHYCVFLDNLTILPDWLSDALSRLSTGEGMSCRALYTDEDTAVFAMRRAVGINGINLVAHKADLLDRALILSFERISDENRLSEKKLWARFEAMRGRLLGALFDCLVKTMREYPKVQLDSL